MLAVHLSEIYFVETKALKHAVQRNLDLFPDDFMFILNDKEVDIVVSQNVIRFKRFLKFEFQLSSYILFSFLQSHRSNKRTT